MIEWDDKYSVGISRIDDEHKQFIDIVNEAIATKEHNDNPEELKELLHKITMYAISHERVANGNSQISNEILEYLKRWLVNHIQVTDRKYIDYFIRNGIK
jgi:hemerythrin